MPESMSFPRPIFDESGAYTINEAGVYEVTSRSVAHYHEVAFAGRDLRTAHEMVTECCRENLDDLHPLLEQSLWISAIIMYSKPFKSNNARPLFDANAFVRSRADSDMRDRHHYLITLRDKMIAHDDALGECKQVAIGLPMHAPKHRVYVGIEPSNPRIVSLGWGIAREMEPHFRAIYQLFDGYRDKVRDETINELLRTNFNDVTLLGLAQKTTLRVDLDSVASRWPRYRNDR